MEVWHKTDRSIFLIYRRWLQTTMPESLEPLRYELDHLDWEKRLVLAPFQGMIEQPLRVYLMGQTAYRYAGGVSEAHPLTPQAAAIMARINTEFGFNGNSILCNEYADGSKYVGYHGDSEAQLCEGTITSDGKTYTGSIVATVSIGATRRFAIKEYDANKQLKRTELHEGDLVLMAGAAQTDFKHSILKQKSAGLRYSLTIRTISD